ncbi:hypothetical protein GURKE_02770 [Brevundimonas phage vB_BpoS-Gurke]|uniref:Uncharacterized protein n=1 Tax=Brevundimonas phage vB_BpoS-Gurke TaxID=2948599 RepID=A0A9E7SQK7_9CAUD|nr:hypothetical protein GURKE_02770 [Brevundimonas phage vB_BpoS-Gurke]
MIDWDTLLNGAPETEAETPRLQPGKTLEAQYGSLIKAGLVRIVRKKGRPPKVIFLTPK